MFIDKNTCVNSLFQLMQNYTISTKDNLIGQLKINKYTIKSSITGEEEGIFNLFANNNKILTAKWETGHIESPIAKLKIQDENLLVDLFYNILYSSYNKELPKMKQ